MSANLASPSTPLPESLSRPIDCLMIDNFDSFTWNLYQMLCMLGANVTVIRNDAIPASALRYLNVNSLIISPGPGHPKTDSGISRDAIKFFAGKIPVLGVCMGLECLVDVFGGEISYAGEIMHGKVSKVRHDGRGVFKEIPQGFKSTRYHSLSATVKTLPAHLSVTAVSEESGVIMGVRHRRYTLEAVQYHPESILSESGQDLLRNFLRLKGGSWEENPTSGVLDTNLPPFPFEAFQSNGKVSQAAISQVPTILEKIYVQRAKDVEQAKTVPGMTLEDISTLLSMHMCPPLIPLVPRLKARKPALMAEIKRASPSKGPIALSANAAQQALTYALSGASVISVLTEPTWFKGTLLDMRLARQAIDYLPNRPAVLRKDFIMDEYQIAEARLHGADTVLLIVAMLPVSRLQALYAYSLSLGMEPLVEVNNAREMTLALELGAKVIGVNNRNLHDFTVDMGTTSRLTDMVREKDVILCALSGITGAQDVKMYTDQGVSAVLVGESLMRAQDTRAFVRELLGLPQPVLEDKRPPLVKICGVRTVQEATAIADAGADMIGLMFVPTSKRCITRTEARKISAAIRDIHQPHSIPSGSGTDEDVAVVNEPWFTTNARNLSRFATRPLLVGVFQNQPLSFVLETIAHVELDMVQLHGNEPADWARHIAVPVIRVFHVGVSGKGLEGVTRPGLNRFVLLDAARPSDGLSGGTGEVLDWDVASRIVQAGDIPVKTPLPPIKPNDVTNGVERRPENPPSPMPIILAGGLTSENVRAAIEKVNPWAVDVSGGVETADKTSKDISKVINFIKAAKDV